MIMLIFEILLQRDQVFAQLYKMIDKTLQEIFR